MADLRDMLISRLIELGTPGGKRLSYLRAAERTGGRASSETIRQIVNRNHSGNFEDETIEGLAALLNVHPDVVYEVANVPRPGTRWRWPERFDRLPPEDRRRLEDIASRMLTLYESAYRHERGA